MSNSADRPTVRFDIPNWGPDPTRASKVALAALAASGLPISNTPSDSNPVAVEAKWLTELLAKFPLLPPGTRLGKMLLGACVGVGSVGIVYRAVHTTLNVAVAVKCLRPDVMNANPDTVTQFACEAQLLAQIAHPGLVRILDFEDDPGLPFVVLEYVDGPSAADLVTRRGPIAARPTIELGIQVAATLDAIRRAGVVHRDVKPANILLAADGTCKLTDLGLATAVSLDRAGANERPMAAGTAAYVAPEQATGGAVDHRSDQYSLGCALYHLIVGRPPFVGRSAPEVVEQHIRRPPIPPHEAAVDVPAEVSQIILRMLKKSPADRYPDFTALREDLIRVLDTLRTATPAPPA